MHIIERKVDRPIEVNQIEYSGLSVTLADSMYQPEMAVVRNTRRICRPDGNLAICPGSAYSHYAKDLLLHEPLLGLKGRVPVFAESLGTNDAFFLEGKFKQLLKRYR